MEMRKTSLIYLVQLLIRRLQVFSNYKSNTWPFSVTLKIRPAESFSILLSAFSLCILPIDL